MLSRILIWGNNINIYSTSSLSYSLNILKHLTTFFVIEDYKNKTLSIITSAGNN